MRDGPVRRRIASMAPPLMASALLLGVHLALPRPAGTVARIAGEILFYAATALWLRTAVAFFHGRRAQPLQILRVPQLLILALFLFFILFNGLEAPPAAGSGAAFRTPWLILFPILLSPLLALLLAAFWSLSTVKRARVRTWHFGFLLVMLSVAFLAESLPSLPGVARGLILFFAIVAMAFTSMRVRWIAFLSKKQKRGLSFLAAAFLVLAILDSVMAFGGGFLIEVLGGLAPGLLQVHRLVMLYSAFSLGMILATTLFHLPTAEAFEQKAREASSLMDISQAITEMIDFRELADKVAAITASVCHADSAWLAILERDGLNVPGVYSVGHEEAMEISRAVIGEIPPDSQGLRILRDQKVRIRMHTDVTTFSFRFLVLAPLTVKNRITGYLFTAIRRDQDLDEDDLVSMRAFASSAAMALENARLLDSRLEKERLLKELEIARDIQHRLLPADPAPDPRFQVAAYFSPAYEAGGDYYDFCRVADGRLAFIIADVSGKGISAAFVMAELKGIFASLATVSSGPRELLVRANQVLKLSLERSRFISAGCGWLDPERRVLHAARAGHMPFFLVSQGHLRRFAPGGLVLGLGGEAAFADKLEEIQVQLQGGDILVFFTDGISEATNLMGQEFGFERICAAVLANCEKSASQIAELVVREVKSFANNPVQHDDITLLVFKIA